MDELAREIAEDQFGDTSPEVVLRIAELIAAEQQRQELWQIVECLTHPLETEVATTKPGCPLRISSRY